MSTTTSHPLSRVLPNRPLGPMRSPARALGWFSIGLGLAELAMPRRLARIAGAPNLPTMTRVFGLREIGTGIGILTSKDPSPWLWGRVAGDALDVATVGAGLGEQRLALGRCPIRLRVGHLVGFALVETLAVGRASPGRVVSHRSPPAVAAHRHRCGGAQHRREP